MIYSIHKTKQFNKDLKTCINRHYNIDLLEAVISDYLIKRIPLPEKYNDHPLKGSYDGDRDCHILSDWVLIYKVNDKDSIITMVRTGTHSDLF